MKTILSILLGVLWGLNGFGRRITDSLFRDNIWYYCNQPKTDAVRNFYPAEKYYLYYETVTGSIVSHNGQTWRATNSDSLVRVTIGYNYTLGDERVICVKNISKDDANKEAHVVFEFQVANFKKQQNKTQK